jgi:hypothetical protein
VPVQETVATKIVRTFYNTTDPESDIPILSKFTVTYGTAAVETEYVNDDNGVYFDTDPTRTEYDALVTAGDYIIAQDSNWDIWMGNIYVRETYYVKAK